jgi:hypothetical protein
VRGGEGDKNREGEGRREGVEEKNKDRGNLGSEREGTGERERDKWEGRERGRESVNINISCFFFGGRGVSYIYI